MFINFVCSRVRQLGFINIMTLFTLGIRNPVGAFSSVATQLEQCAYSCEGIVESRTKGQ